MCKPNKILLHNNYCFDRLGIHYFNILFFKMGKTVNTLCQNQKRDLQANSA